MRKVYFITKPDGDATQSGRWRHTLKQTYKSSDAIRDVLEWSRDGREFYVCIREKGTGRRRTMYHINPPGSAGLVTDMATGRPVIGVIERILQWTQDGSDFDITLLERRRPVEAGEDDALEAAIRAMGKRAN